MHRLLCVFTVIFLVSTLQAQEQERPGFRTFPIFLVLEAAGRAKEASGRLWPDRDILLSEVWRPDWPLEIPPDSFKTISGDFSRIIVRSGNYSLNCAYDSEGRPEEFPLYLNGQIAQVSLFCDENSEIRKITLDFPNMNPVSEEADTAPGDASDSWILEMPDDFLFNSPGSAAQAIRVSWGGELYFVFLSGGGNEFLETWYTTEGNALGIYEFTCVKIGPSRRISVIKDLSNNSTEERYYDSRGFLTDISGPFGVYRVGYFREDLPRYWDRRAQTRTGDGTGEAGDYNNMPVNLSLQWDERGLLVRMSTASAGEILVDSRYEYSLDSQGNWTERREIRMVRAFGYLVPSPGYVVRRVLEYRQAE